MHVVNVSLLTYQCGPMATVFAVDTPTYLALHDLRNAALRVFASDRILITSPPR